MDLTKVGFAAGAIGKEMESFSAGKAAALWVSNTMAGGYVAYTDGETLDATNASIAIGVNWYDQLDGIYEYYNLSGMNNLSGNNESFTYTEAIQAQQAKELADGVNLAGVTFAGNQSIGDLSYAFNSAVMPSGENAALSTMLGVLLYACLLYTSPSPRD